jgi:hypothetical protein
MTREKERGRDGEMQRNKWKVIMSSRRSISDWVEGVKKTGGGRKENVPMSCFRLKAMNSQHIIGSCGRWEE